MKCWWNWPLVSISSTFYEQLLCLQIPKAQKKTVKSSSFFALLGSLSVKSDRRTLVKLTTADLFKGRESGVGSIVDNDLWFGKREVACQPQICIEISPSIFLTEDIISSKKITSSKKLGQIWVMKLLIVQKESLKAIPVQPYRNLTYLDILAIVLQMTILDHIKTTYYI